jgi:hypothetical protein
MIVPVANRHFGSGRLGLFLPLWAEKDFGAWSLFGGGGYNINPGPDQRNFWLSGGDFAAHDHGPVKPRYRGLSPDA